MPGKTEIFKNISDSIINVRSIWQMRSGIKSRNRETEGYHALVALMGDGILAPDGQIDKPAMAAKIFCRSDTVWNR